MSENLTQQQKDKILEEIFKDQAALLRQFKADIMVEKGIAKTFREAAEMIKAEELAKEKEPFSNSPLFLSEQEKGLLQYLKEINSKD